VLLLPRKCCLLPMPHTNDWPRASNQLLQLFTGFKEDNQRLRLWSLSTTADDLAHHNAFHNPCLTGNGHVNDLTAKAACLQAVAERLEARLGRKNAQVGCFWLPTCLLHLHARDEWRVRSLTECNHDCRLGQTSQELQRAPFDVYHCTTTWHAIAWILPPQKVAECGNLPLVRYLKVVSGSAFIRTWDSS